MPQKSESEKIIRKKVGTIQVNKTSEISHDTIQFPRFSDYSTGRLGPRLGLRGIVGTYHGGSEATEVFLSCWLLWLDLCAVFLTSLFAYLVLQIVSPKKLEQMLCLAFQVQSSVSRRVNIRSERDLRRVNSHIWKVWVHLPVHCSERALVCVVYKYAAVDNMQLRWLFF